MSAWDMGLLLDIELILLQGLAMGFLIGIAVLGAFFSLCWVLLALLDVVDRLARRVMR